MKTFQKQIKVESAQAFLKQSGIVLSDVAAFIAANAEDADIAHYVESEFVGWRIGLKRGSFGFRKTITQEQADALIKS